MYWHSCPLESGGNLRNHFPTSLLPETIWNMPLHYFQHAYSNYRSDDPRTAKDELDTLSLLHNRSAADADLSKMTMSGLSYPFIEALPNSIKVYLESNCPRRRRNLIPSNTIVRLHLPHQNYTTGWQWHKSCQKEKLTFVWPWKDRHIQIVHSILTSLIGESPLQTSLALSKGPTQLKWKEDLQIPKDAGIVIRNECDDAKRQSCDKIVKLGDGRLKQLNSKKNRLLYRSPLYETDYDKG